MEVSLGFGTTEEFLSSGFKNLALKDKRLENRALMIFKALQSRLTTCVRRLFTEAKEARPAYDFF
jgi:hypothetical protein